MKKSKRYIKKLTKTPLINKWEECPCMKGIRLEDVTPELEEKAYNEMKNK